MPLYFAYGSNMDAAAMAARCPRSQCVGRGRLAGFRTIVMASGFVSVEEDRRMCVHGVLWDVAVGDVAALEEAIRVYERCLKYADADSALRDDAEPCRQLDHRRGH